MDTFQTVLFASLSELSCTLPVPLLHRYALYSSSLLSNFLLGSVFWSLKMGSDLCSRMELLLSELDFFLHPFLLLFAVISQVLVLEKCFRLPSICERPADHL